MNNIIKKNIVNTISAKTELPYQSTSDVTVKSNQIVHAALNYALQKLLDNDLYIEKKLICESNYQEGPKLKVPEQVPTYIDNYKFFDGIDGTTNDLSIVQKIPYKIEDTLTTKLSSKSNFILDHNKYFTGTDAGLYDSFDLSNWNKTEFDGLNTAKINGYYADEQKILFAADDGIYQLSNIENLLSSAIEKPICSKITEISSNAICKFNDELIIGRREGLFSAPYNSKHGTLGKAIRENTVNGNVNCIETVCSNTMEPLIVGSDNGLYGSYEKTSFKNLSNVFDSKLEYTTCYRQSSSSRYFYFGTENGIFRYDSESSTVDEIKTYNDSTVQNVRKIKSIGDSFYVCAKGLWLLNASTGKLDPVQNELFKDFVVVDIAINNGLTIVGTSNGLYWYDENDVKHAWQKFDKFPNETIVNIIIKDNNIFVATSNSLYRILLSNSEMLVTNRALEKQADLDVTTVYTDRDQMILIGAETGLYDEKYQRINMYSTEIEVGTTVYDSKNSHYITDRVNNIRFLTIFDEETYVICTTHGAYLLNYVERKDENENIIGAGFVLGDYHVLPTYNVIDVSYYDNTFILVTDNKIMTINIDESMIENTSTKQFEVYHYMLDENNYNVLNYPNNISKVAVLDGLIALDGTDVKKFKLTETIKDAVSKDNKNLVGNNIKFIKKVDTQLMNQYRPFVFASDDKGMHVLTSVQKADGKYAYEFQALNSGNSVIEHLINDYASTSVNMLYNIQSNIYQDKLLVAKQDNANVLSVFDMAIKYANIGNDINVEKCELDSKIIGAATLYNTNSIDYTEKAENATTLIATQNSLYALDVTPAVVENLSVTTDEYNITKSLIQVGIFPYLSRKAGEANYSRYNFYLGISEANALYYYNTIEEDDDLGSMRLIHDIDGINLDCNVYQFVAPDEAVSTNNEHLNNTAGKSMPIYLATEDGLFAGNLNYGSTAINNFTNILPISTKSAAILKTATNNIIFALVRDPDDSTKHYLHYANIPINSANYVFKKYNYAFNDADIAKISAFDGIIYVCTKDSVYAILASEISKTNYSTAVQRIYNNNSVFDLGIDRIGNKLVIHSTNSNIKVYDKTSGLADINGLDGTPLRSTTTFAQHDYTEDKNYIYFQSNGELLRYDGTSLEHVNYISNFTNLKPASHITNYIVRDSDVSADTQCFTEMYFTENGIYNYFYQTDFSTILENKIDRSIYNNAHINCIDSLDFMVDVVDFDYENSNETTENASYQYTASYAIIGTDHGLFIAPTKDSISQYAISTYDSASPLLTANVVAVNASNDAIYALTKEENINYLYICKTLLAGSDEVVKIIDISKKQVNVGTANINDIEFVDLIKSETSGPKIHFAASDGLYYSDNIKNLEYVNTFKTNINCMYESDRQIVLGDNSTIYNYFNDTTQLTSIAVNMPVLRIYDTTNMYGIMFGSNTGVMSVEINGIGRTTNIDSLLDPYFIDNIYMLNSEYYYEIDNSVQKIITTTSKVIVEESTTEKLYTPKNLQIRNAIDYNSTQLLINAAIPRLFDIYGEYEVELDTGLQTDLQIDQFWKDVEYEFMKIGNSIYYRVGSKGRFNELFKEDPDKLTRVNFVNNGFIIDANDGIYKYDTISGVRYYKKIIASTKVNSIFKISDNNLLIGTNNGLYQYVDGNVLKNKILSGGKVGAIYNYITDAENNLDTYLISFNGSVYRSMNKKFTQFNKIIDLSEYGVTDIYGINVKNTKVLIFATNKGLIYTQDLYYLVDTYSKLDVNGARYKIQEFYDTAVKNHIQNEHKSDSAITKANASILATDFSNLTKKWQKQYNNRKIIENDIVDNVEFNGDVAYMHATYQNFSNKYNEATKEYEHENIEDISYIMKQWKSGMKEIFINIPSTHTYYVNHIDGLAGCTHSEHSFQRDNVKNPISGSVKDACTNVKLYLDNRHFKIKTLLNVFINGTSLPLKIYIDKNKDDNKGANNYFHSYMLPSISKTVPMVNSVTGNVIDDMDEICLEFSCFGTDEQNIRIIAEEIQTYSIVFDSNDANSGNMDDMVVKVDKAYNLDKCKFVKDGYMFVGWSRTKNGEVEFKDNQQIYNLSYVNGDVVKLYAVWKYYLFDSSTDTVLKLNSNKEKFYLAYGDTTTNSGVIIDYDYVGDTTLVLKTDGTQFNISHAELKDDSTQVIIEFED